MIVTIDPTTGMAINWVMSLPPGASRPTGAVEISDTLDPLSIYIDPTGAVRPLPPRPGATWAFDRASGAWADTRSAAEVLAAAQSAAQTRITALRGQARLAYITNIPGQEAIYIAKLEEARAYLAEDDPDIADYPLIGSEVGVTAPTPYEVAQIFLNLNALWVQVAAAIDGTCFTAEIAVQAAISAEEVDTIITALAAQLGGTS